MRPTLISSEQFRFDFRNPQKVQWAFGTEPPREDDCVHSMEYFVNDETIARRFGHSLDPLLADWIDVALACYLADRLAQRRPLKAAWDGKHWSRIFNITVPVRQPESWNRQVQASLSSLLAFLTEDSWQFNFVKRETPGRVAESQGFLFASELDSPVRVALYSGGLDSFAGAAHALKNSLAKSFVFVSGVTHNRQQAGQRAQLNTLRLRTSAQIYHIGIPYGLRWATSQGQRKEESTQRTRGFLFLTLGACSALAAASKELFLYENGIGAINLPYDGTQLGTYNGRATHPSTLLKMECFIRVLTGEPFSIHNPFLFATKGEMCSDESVRELAEFVHLTFSCDGFPVGAKNRAQCGSCTSCILRRFALESAGLARYDDSGYLNDLSSTTFVGKAKQLDALRVMNWQVQRMSLAFFQADPWQALVSDFIELQKLELDFCRNGKLQPADLRRKLLHLYWRYASEWKAFSARRHCDLQKSIA
jgi:7-cyano-7-deazaguanine synthase in queuosine biosynthesis